MPVLTLPRRQAVHADDGQQHVVPDLRPLLGGQEVSRGSGEEVLGRLGVGGLHVADVDDGVNPGEGVVETFAGEHIDAARGRPRRGRVPPAAGPRRCGDRRRRCHRSRQCASNSSSDNGETPVVSAFDRDEGDLPFRIEVQAPAVGLCELRIHARGFEKNVCPNSLRRAFNSPAEMPWCWV